MNCKRTLILYIEPTPYKLALIKNIRSQCDGSIVRVFFLGANISQSWNIKNEIEDGYILPRNRWRAWKLLIKELRDADVLHVAGWGSLFMILIWLTAYLLRIPLVVESDTQISKFQNIGVRLAKRFVYPFLFKIPACFLPYGSRQASYFRSYKVRSKKIVLANMTVDVKDISFRCDSIRRSGKIPTIRAANGLPEQAVVFLYVGRLEQYKGIQDLLQAFSMMTEKDRQAFLVIVGDGSLRDQVHFKANEIDRIHYVGRKSYGGVVQLLSISDVVVVPSTFEPWGLVVNEAMAAGLPVIATDQVGSVDDLVINNKNGLVVAAGSLSSLVGAMSHMMNSATRLAMGERSKEVIANWTIENMAEIVTRVWKKVIRTDD